MLKNGLRQNAFPCFASDEALLHRRRGFVAHSISNAWNIGFCNHQPLHPQSDDFPKGNSDRRKRLKFYEGPIIGETLKSKILEPVGDDDLVQRKLVATGVGFADAFPDGDE